MLFKLPSAVLLAISSAICLTEAVPARKYFHEAVFHHHYDGRFANKPLPEHKQLPHLSHLVQTYFNTMHEIGAETWIMHGSLLGWWWNRKIMPWDDDVDVQVSEQSIHLLASQYNMTVHHFKVPGSDEGRTYMLEVNPNYINHSTDDTENVIDARWIDMDTGLFIDITAVHHDHQAEGEGEFGKLLCKDRHGYLQKQIFPLRDSMFEGVPVKVPFAYEELLELEYGTAALFVRDYKDHHFDQERLEWIRVPKQETLKVWSAYAT